MPRRARVILPDRWYHVWTRGSARNAIFADDHDHVVFGFMLTEVAARYGLRLLAESELTNHLHMVVRTSDGRLSAAMQALLGGYARRYNGRHGRDAHVFRNRFGARLIETDADLLWVVRYVERNAFAAGLCSHPADWPWSTFGAVLGLRPAPSFLDVDTVLGLFSPEPDRARALYGAFVTAEHPGAGSAEQGPHRSGRARWGSAERPGARTLD